jgi:hypothetical protein
MLCDSCLAKNLRAGAPDTEAARMQLKQAREAAKKANKGKGKGKEQADGVTQHATENSGASGAGTSSGKRKRSNGRRLTTQAELRTWVEWQLLGLSPTAACQEEYIRESQRPSLPRKAKSTTPYTEDDDEGAREVELELRDEMEPLQQREPGDVGEIQHAARPARAGEGEGTKAEARQHNVRQGYRHCGRWSDGGEELPRHARRSQQAHRSGQLWQRSPVGVYGSTVGASASARVPSG